nr:MAG TPA: hypothetical protein [Caudoviricetes sp.]
MCGVGARILPFPDLDAGGVDRLIHRSRLSRENKIIARKYLHGEKLVDIAVLREISLSRSAVGKRIHREILPELERVAKL